MSIVDKRHEAHWMIGDYKQRMTTGQWKVILLNNNDTVTYAGRVRQLVAKKLGYGVVEVSKNFNKIPEGSK